MTHCNDNPMPHVAAAAARAAFVRAAKRLRLARKRSGMSRHDAARAAGIAVRTAMAIERAGDDSHDRDGTRVGAASWVTYAVALGVPLDELFA